ncbi:hypothetical protein PanWU01x14_074780 [Parasponia andersonii]|uniref:Transmembrane protein n=1 Tax=Parasponia andersonii TaxID=3476 RepID=A0A2P5DDH3_PARAD|nr:hypothetical protein PanWU01x14_074780 [Parasponia andersonii]
MEINSHSHSHTHNSYNNSKSTRSYPVFVLVLTSLCVTMMIVAVWTLSSGVPSLTTTPNPVSKLKHSVPNLAQLQRNVIIGSDSGHDHDRDHHLRSTGVGNSDVGSTSAFHVINRFNNRTVQRKFVKPSGERQKLERGLAAARAGIRSAASSSGRNLSSTINDTDYVPNGVVYRNPAAFYQ